MPRPSLRLLFACLGICCAAAAAHAAPVAPAAVAIIEDAPWSPGDASREGAGEFAVLLQLAALQRAHEHVGLVGVGDERGRFQLGTQRGLEFAARHGVPVVRLTSDPARAAGSVDDEFIPGGRLGAEAAQLLLRECLARFGPLPIEAKARRAVLAHYRAAFREAQPEFVASK